MLFQPQFANVRGATVFLKLAALLIETDGRDHELSRVGIEPVAVAIEFVNRSGRGIALKCSLLISLSNLAVRCARYGEVILEKADHGDTEHEEALRNKLFRQSLDARATRRSLALSLQRHAKIKTDIIRAP